MLKTIKAVKVVLMGYGNVRRHFVQLLLEKEEEIVERYQVKILLSGIIGKTAGLVNPQGLDLNIIAGRYGNRPVGSLPGAGKEYTGLKGMLASQGEVLVEATPTDLTSGESGLTHLKHALHQGLHAVTLTKGPLVLAYRIAPGLKLKDSCRYSG